MIGVMSGATSIAPITTAVLSFISPSAAIDDENTISVTKRIYVRLASNTFEEQNVKDLRALFEVEIPT